METETKGMVTRGRVWEMGKKVEGNINNIVISLCVDSWLLEVVGDHIVMYNNIRSRYYTPETNITN